MFIIVDIIDVTGLTWHISSQCSCLNYRHICLYFKFQVCFEDLFVWYDWKIIPFSYTYNTSMLCYIIVFGCMYETGSVYYASIRLIFARSKPLINFLLLTQWGLVMASSHWEAFQKRWQAHIHLYMGALKIFTSQHATHLSKYEQDILLGIAKDTFKIPHKTSYPYIEK